MSRLLEGGNWQSGCCAGSLHISIQYHSFQHRCTSLLGISVDKERYDGLPQRWIAIIEAARDRESRKVIGMLEEYEYR